MALTFSKNWMQYFLKIRIGRKIRKGTIYFLDDPPCNAAYRRFCRIERRPTGAIEKIG